MRSETAKALAKELRESASDGTLYYCDLMREAADALDAQQERIERLTAWCEEPLASEEQMVPVLMAIGIRRDDAEVAATAALKAIEDARAEVRAIIRGDQS